MAATALQRLTNTTRRLVVGLMSGTSLDGVDAAIARLEGSSTELTIEPLGFVHEAYPDELRSLLYANSHAASSSVLELSQLNVRLAHLYAAAVREAMRAAGLSLREVDLVGSHGQTVHHVPQPADCAGQPVTSTLQIGDPSVLATLLSTPVVGDFRMADMALGGEGAPLVPYFDWAVFRSEETTRGLLNVGGIANLTVLPKGASRDELVAFDTGPGNMVIDALAQRYLGRPFDENGARAIEGRVANEVLAACLEDDFFNQPPPRSTGREYFGESFVERFTRAARSAGLSNAADLLATATALTAAATYKSYVRYVRPRHELEELIVSGGGVHNTFLMQKLEDAFAPVRVSTTADYGIDPDAKEALCFAVLAHETVNGVPTNIPSATGASRAAVLGKLCIPAANER